ncbi:MAG: 3-hydroxyacyl-CoA dehydrogenase NAD-binding domain-containing protein [Pseudomonadota bacterium]
MSALDRSSLVVVAGAGTMGRGIAEVALRAGHPVVLVDGDHAVADDAADVIRDHLATAEGPVGRLTPAYDFSAVGRAALVIEAIPESFDAKSALLAEIERRSPEAILATNSSSFSVTALAKRLADPARLVGLHFFNPATTVPVVEVVRGLDSRDEVVEVARATVAQWGKRPIVCRSTPGFVVHRATRPYFGEALLLLEEGAVDAATLDAIMVETAGFKTGPCALMDRIGHDVVAKVTRTVHEALGHDPRYRPSFLQEELVDAGHLGKRTGRGLFDHASGAPGPLPVTSERCAPPPVVTQTSPQPRLKPLAEAAAPAGVQLVFDPTSPVKGLRLPDGALLEVTRGQPAMVRARANGVPVVLVDLALDFGRPARVVLTPSDDTPPTTLAAAVGLCQAAGAEVSVIDDVPGMVVMRTVALLANEAADAVLHDVADAAAIDAAVRDALDAPLGPLAWADRVGPARLVQVLDAIDDVDRSGRYRASPLLRRHALVGRPFLAD